MCGAFGELVVYFEYVFLVLGRVVNEGTLDAFAEIAMPGVGLIVAHCGQWKLWTVVISFACDFFFFFFLGGG